jgi:hypothetical protein
MEGRTARSAVACGEQHRGSPGGVIRDSRWVADARCAVYCAATFCGLVMLLDWGTGGLDPERAALWVALGAMVFALLLPSRVTAGDGWLAVRGLVHERRVRTEALVSIQRFGGIAVHLILRDTEGNWVELDPRVLVANPMLWHRLDTAACRSDDRGTLREGMAALLELRGRVDHAEAQAVFRASGLEALK